MSYNLKTSLGRFRVMSLIEGISTIVLFFIAMPMKYFMDMPMAVKIAGWAHGIFFLTYLYALLQVTLDQKWSMVKALLAFIASLIPFGPFFFEAKLRNEEQQRANA